MTFGWQGFSLEHPEDWAPVSLVGGRKEGYARIASPTRLSLQVRWKESKPGVDLSSVLSTYLDRLKSDAKKSKKEFRSQTEDDSGTLLYRYSSDLHGRGAILQSESCGRVFFLEAISSRTDSLLPTFRKLLDSFQSQSGNERWSLFGLDLLLPAGLDVEKKVLQAGRTQLTLTCKDARVEAQRWGFAEQLVSKHGLEQWARSVLRIPKAQSVVTDQGVSFEVGSTLLKKPQFGLVGVQPDRNQITTVMVTTRKEQWRPSWTWLD